MSGVAIDRIRRIEPIFRSREAVAAGVSWRDLYTLRDNGQILELSAGSTSLPSPRGSTTSTSSGVRPGLLTG